MGNYLICYDITNKKRLQKIHRRLKGKALPVQYSIFLFVGDIRTLNREFDSLKKLIDPKSDDLRCYPLPKQGQRLFLGRSILPAGIIHSDMLDIIG